MKNLSKKFLKRVGLGRLITKVGRTKNPRRRTLHTYQNKLQKLKSQYEKLSKNPKFKEKYPDAESFLSNYNLKEVSRG